MSASGNLLCRAIVLAVILSAPGGRLDAQHDAHSLGTVNMTVSCSAQAKAEFNHAVALLHHMTLRHA